MEKREEVSTEPECKAGLPSVPEELKALPRWVTHDSLKIPFDPRTGNMANSTDTSTWCSYATAIAKCNRYAGIGCMIAPPYCGIDLDKCRNPETGETEPWAEAIIKELNSYTELSPSGTGFHIWVKCELKRDGRRRAGRVEMYDHSRYFTMTGRHQPGTPASIEERDLTSLQQRLPNLDPNYVKQAEMRQAERAPISGSKSKFDALMAGEGVELYESPSEADASLCVRLAAKHNCNSELIDAEFRQSGLMREKWDEKHGSQTYGQITISSAVEFVKPDEPINWRGALKSYDQMEQGEIKFLVKKVFPYGVNLIGGLSATGKTWFALSLAQALISGKRFLGHFDVPDVLPVIYLIPESGERPFRARLDRMRLNEAGESFLCRTMHNGPILGLQSPELLEACRVIKPVVILDTAIRFSSAQDENSSSQNRELASGMFNLITAGAPSVVAIHHSPKASANEHDMTLENTLRGTGDFGAMSDAVYSLRCMNQENLELRIQCVKARDFEPVKPFHVQGRPFIDKTGNFSMLTQPGLGKEQIEMQKLVGAIEANPQATYREIESLTGIGTSRIRVVADRAGWKKGKDGWSQSEDDGLWSPQRVN